ncbi:MAG: hypothetical protein M1825_000435 [Sarcosagium campestre]|nr:MAG: hypothetical protein M1825_000435 [Sarcosagium campestre]
MSSLQDPYGVQEDARGAASTTEAALPFPHRRPSEGLEGRPRLQPRQRSSSFGAWGRPRAGRRSDYTEYSIYSRDYSGSPAKELEFLRDSVTPAPLQLRKQSASQSRPSVGSKSDTTIAPRSRRASGDKITFSAFLEAHSRPRYSRAPSSAARTPSAYASVASSEFSFSHFPWPPAGPAGSASERFSTDPASPGMFSVAASSPLLGRSSVLRPRGSSLDTINPRESLPLDITRDPDERHLRHISDLSRLSPGIPADVMLEGSSLPLAGVQNTSAERARMSKPVTPQRALFSDLHTAHSSITSRSSIQRPKGTSPESQADAPLTFSGYDDGKLNSSSSTENDGAAPIPPPRHPARPTAAAQGMASPSTMPFSPNLDSKPEHWFRRISGAFQRRSDAKDKAGHTPHTDLQVLSRDSPTLPFDDLTTHRRGGLAGNLDGSQDMLGETYMDRDPAADVWFKSGPDLVTADRKASVSLQNPAGTVEDTTNEDFDTMSGSELPRPRRNARDETGHEALTDRAGFGTFDFDLQGGINSSSPDGHQAEDPLRHAKLERKISLNPSGLPPSTPLPPGPPSNESRERRNASSVSENTSSIWSHEDTGVLLDLTGPLPQMPAIDDTYRYPVAKPQDDVGQKSDDGAIRSTTKGSHSDGSRLSAPSARTGRSRPISAVSSWARDVSLESEISREFRRFSQMSGVSNMTGSVIMLDEHSARKMSLGAPINHDLTGEFHSSSSHAFSSTDSFNAFSDMTGRDQSSYENLHLADSLGTGAVVRMNNVKGQGRLVVSKRSTQEPTYPQNRILEERHGEDGDRDGDWETVVGSRPLTRIDTGLGIGHATAGSSLADNSSEGSLSSVRRGRGRASRGEGSNDAQYTTPEGAPELPLSATPNFSNAPLPPLPPPQDGQVHLFRSSPPPVMNSDGTIIHSSPPSNGPERRGSKLWGNRRSYLEPLGDVASETAEYFEGPETGDQLGESGHVWRNFQSGTEEHIDGRSYGTMFRSGSASDEGSEPELPSANGSFAKYAVLGPKHNITGTPQGTNMREVGSSLAGMSTSPATHWTISPGHLRSSPPRLQTSPTLHTPVSFPKQAMLSPESSHIRSPTSPADSDDVFEMALPGDVEKGPVHPGSLIPMFPFQRPDTATRSHRSSRISPRNTSYPPPPVVYNPTAPLPRYDYELWNGFEVGLRRHPRSNSSVATINRERKIHLSRVILAICMLFPPLLLLYGYDMLDSLVLTVSKGEISQFGRSEKRVALWLGWSIASIAVAGIVIGMIVIAVA